MKIAFDKLYRWDRKEEPCALALPVAKGKLWDAGSVQVKDGSAILPSQTKVTARYEDGSIKFLFTRFLTDLPGNAKKELEVEWQNTASEDMTSEDKTSEKCVAVSASNRVSENQNGFTIDCGKLKFKLCHGSTALFESLDYEKMHYEAKQIAGPLLKTDDGSFFPAFGRWRTVEKGPVCVILEADGVMNPGQDVLLKPEQNVPCDEMVPQNHKNMSGEGFRFVCRVTAYAGKPWLDIACRLINATEEKQHIRSWTFVIQKDSKSPETEPGDAKLVRDTIGKSTGGGSCFEEQNIIRTTGINELPEIEAGIDCAKMRTCVGRSNYKTDFTLGNYGEKVSVVADADLLVAEANEHFAEVFYGTFFGDVTDEKGGVCATVFQAQQNFPKAIVAEKNRLTIMLVPEAVDYVAMQSGMSREQRFMLHFHDAEESLTELDNRSLIYQMPDIPYVLPEEFRRAGVFHDVFLDRNKMDQDAEIALIAKADGHARCYGMMNWGDAPDPGYTNQGRGGGKLVWTNNEYDYPHAMYLMYARTGTRRFLDYANVAVSHWMDVDVCHYSESPLEMGGQWEHTYEHCGGKVMACSHEWVEGLLDCYHFTGNERALSTALGIGENVLRLLETPMFEKSGESSARETGWALRTLTALYVETHDEKWTEKCKWIVGHFREWNEEYGEWIAPYTDNTTIRVGFMISVAVGSLMRYYRVFRDEEVRSMILHAVDDLVDNCLMPNGLFYYKELPSLSRNGNNTLLLEALVAAYELTGEKRYLEYGVKTYRNAMSASVPGAVGSKRKVEDTVIAGSGATKSFAQSFLPLVTYYKAMAEEGML